MKTDGVLKKNGELRMSGVVRCGRVIDGLIIDEVRREGQTSTRVGCGLLRCTKSASRVARSVYEPTRDSDRSRSLYSMAALYLALKMMTGMARTTWARTCTGTAGTLLARAQGGTLVTLVHCTQCLLGFHWNDPAVDGGCSVDHGETNFFGSDSRWRIRHRQSRTFESTLVCLVVVLGLPVATIDPTNATRVYLPPTFQRLACSLLSQVDESLVRLVPGLD